MPGWGEGQWPPCKDRRRRRRPGARTTGRAQATGSMGVAYLRVRGREVWRRLPHATSSTNAGGWCDPYGCRHVLGKNVGTQNPDGREYIS